MLKFDQSEMYFDEMQVRVIHGSYYKRNVEQITVTWISVVGCTRHDSEF